MHPVHPSPSVPTTITSAPPSTIPSLPTTFTSAAPSTVTSLPTISTISNSAVSLSHGSHMVGPSSATKDVVHGHPPIKHSHSDPTLHIEAIFGPDIKPPPRPPPSRTVEQHHHKHHFIEVNSETDFTKMHIDENKVNYLLYNPPVAVSQTGLIQSIGKPFSRNHAKFLPDPGFEFMLTRRVSEVRLKHVKALGDVNPKLVDRLAKLLKFFAGLIGIIGLFFFIYILSLSAVSTPMEYVMYFLDGNAFYKVVYICGVLQPIAVAPYCRYALINLKHIRGYFLRVPLSLIFPIAVICLSINQLYAVSRPFPNGQMYLFLRMRMRQYYLDDYDSDLAKRTWNGIQRLFKCCGYRNSEEWKTFNKTHLPTSCCPENTDCTVGSKDVYNTGCDVSYIGVNVILAILFCTFGTATIVVEIFSIITMRSLYAVIGKELYDERSSLGIMWGRLCSVCDVEDTDVELEYDEENKENNDSDSSFDSDEIFETTHTSATARTSQTSSQLRLDMSRISVMNSHQRGRGRGIGRGVGRGMRVAPI